MFLDTNIRTAFSEYCSDGYKLYTAWQEAVSAAEHGGDHEWAQICHDDWLAHARKCQMCGEAVGR